MEKTWRWFGKNDPITLSDLRQINVEGIVTALHDIPTGEVWSLEEILDLKKHIEDAGLHWSVVESLLVPESIKYGGPDRDQLIENYKISLTNLGKAGIKTVCYNFMPIVDWIRTDLRYKLADGTYTLYFSRVRFAYFDIYILKRENAEADYPPEVLEAVHELDKTITEAEKAELIENIIIKTQGFVNDIFKEGEQDPVAHFNRLMAKYKGIDKQQMRENFKYFLQHIIPVVNEYDMHLCIHPDDPPFPVLGLPRIVTDEEDIEWILTVVDNPRNGLTFCGGSLGSCAHNDVMNLARRFSCRTHFIHLRDTHVLPNGDFVEASNLGINGNLLELFRLFKTSPLVPMRIDHAPLILTDVDAQDYNPGYSFLGRMKAFCEMSGMMTATLFSDDAG